MKSVCTLLVSLFFCVAGVAQQVDSAATIQTSDGEIYTGRIVKYEEGTSVTIVQSGRGYILDWSMIKSIKSAEHNIGTTGRPAVDTSKITPRQKEVSAKQAERKSKNELATQFYKKPKVMLGIGGGWGAPYGLGADVSVIFKGYVDVNAGMGFDLGGFRIGAGSRVFILGRRIVNPYVGLAFAYNTGFDGAYIEVNGRKKVYKVPNGGAFHLRGGIRINSKIVSFLINGGYGFAFGGKKDVICTSCTYDPIADGAGATLGPGNLEVSFSLLFRIANKFIPLRRLQVPGFQY